MASIRPGKTRLNPEEGDIEKGERPITRFNPSETQSKPDNTIDIKIHNPESKGNVHDPRSIMERVIGPGYVLGYKSAGRKKKTHRGKKHSRKTKKHLRRK